MNTAEIDTFTQRLGRFTDQGLTLPEAEVLTDRLVVRDREQDDRRVCLECPHLRGVGRWRCGNGMAAGVAIRAGDTPLPAELVGKLKRCDGWSMKGGGGMESLGLPHGKPVIKLCSNANPEFAQARARTGTVWVRVKKTGDTAPTPSAVPCGPQNPDSK